MKKLAVFVEGYTELLFIDRIVQEVAGSHRVRIDHRRILGGSTARRTARYLKAIQPDSGEEFYVLIVDCTGDDQVKTRIDEEHTYLTNNGYERIVGIRDVFPKYTRSDVARLEAYLPRYIKTKLTPVEWVLSIMEIEAWFLAEFTHFPRIDPAITVAGIRTALGFDPEHDDMSQRANPAADLDACYALGGRAYLKGNGTDTVSALNYEFIYLELRNRIPYLNKLLRIIDAFLTPA